MPDMPQLHRDDLKTMSPEQISEAHREGRLADVLEGRDDPDHSPTTAPVGNRVGLTLDDLRKLSQDDVVRLDRTGVIKDITGMSAAAAGLLEPDRDLDAREGPPIPRQLTEADLAGMSPDAIVLAYSNGQCDRLLGRS